MAELQNTIRKMTECTRRKTPAFAKFNDLATTVEYTCAAAVSEFFKGPADLAVIAAQPDTKLLRPALSGMAISAAWQFEDETGNQFIMAIDKKCAVLAAGWALDRVLPDVDALDESGEESLSILDRQLAYLFANQVIPKINAALNGEEGEQPVEMASTYFEPVVLPEMLALSPRFGLLYEIQSEENSLGRMAIFGAPPQADVAEQQAPDEDVLHQWRACLKQNVINAPLNFQAIIASKTSSINALSNLKPGDTVPFYGASIEEVGMQSALCEKPAPLITSSLGSKDGMRALQTYARR